MGKRDVIVLLVIGAEDWRALIKEYLLIWSLPSNKMEAIKLTMIASGYCLIDGVLYRRSTSPSLLKCLSSEESTYVLREMHEGVCRWHTGFRALATQTTRVGFLLASILQESKDLVKKCDERQRFAQCQGSPQLR